MKTKNIGQTQDLPLHSKKAFTLVELIIVITILAILATIAFMSFKGYMKGARDGNRLSTLNSINKGLKIYLVKTGTIPLPENITRTGIVGTEILAFVGNIGDNISRQININKIPQDPLSNTNYIYGTDVNKTKYQISTVLEDIQASNIMINQTYAYAGYKAKVMGNYNGLLKVGTSLYNLPSLIFLGTGNLINNSTGFIIDKGQNLPYKLNITDPENTENITQQLQQLTGTSALVLTGITITDWNGQSGSLETAFGYKIDSIGQTYYGDKYLTEIKNQEVTITETPANTCTSWTYSTGACQPDNTATLTIATSLPSSCTGGAPLTSTTCTYVAPFSCGTSTVIAGGYTYSTISLAGKCRTIGSMKHGTKLLAGTTMPSDINTIEKWCYNNTDINCTNDGGLYTWYESMGLNDTQNTITVEDTTKSVCGQLGTGWHLPSDADWTALTTAGATGWTGNKLSGLISSLPGYRNTGGGFSAIASNGYWWSSSRVSTVDAYYRYLYISVTTVNSTASSKLYSWSVLCIKN